MQRVARIDQGEVREIVPSHHCVLRFRQRRPFRDAGVDAVADALITALEDADVTSWPPAWGLADRATDLWALNGELAFPLQRTPLPGRFLATTCLVKPRR